MKQFLFRLLATLAVGIVLAAPAVSEWWGPPSMVTATGPAKDTAYDTVSNSLKLRRDTSFKIFEKK